MINESYPILNQKYYLQDPSRYKDNHQPKIKQEAFEQETKILSQLHHPNIIGLVDYGVGQLRRTNKFQIKNST